MNKSALKLLFCAWILTLLILTILSYTQVDLNLTLLNWAPYLTIQKQFTQLGYFNRPFNGILFSGLFIALLVGYVALVKYAHSGEISLTQLKKLALITGAILLFSYSVFSHDLFNYIFDARILTHYHQNPYLQKALDYPGDDWIRFMQWTHRTYPYGPTWLAITAIPSLLGFSKLLPTYLLFKVLFISCYYVLLWYAVKINEVRKLKSTTIAVSFALLAFNPLILIDGLVSSRIDLVMATVGIIAVYYHINSQPKKEYFWLLISGGTKFATLFFVPLFLYGYKRLKDVKFFLLLSAIALCTTLLQSVLRGLQPWYFILPATILPFLYPHIRLRTILIVSLMMLLPMSTYLHLIYTGISQDALWFLWR